MENLCSHDYNMSCASACVRVLCVFVYVSLEIFHVHETNCKQCCSNILHTTPNIVGFSLVLSVKFRLKRREREGGEDKMCSWLLLFLIGKLEELRTKNIQYIILNNAYNAFGNYLLIKITLPLHRLALLYGVVLPIYSEIVNM